MNDEQAKRHHEIAAAWAVIAVCLEWGIDMGVPEHDSDSAWDQACLWGMPHFLLLPAPPQAN